MTKKERNIKRYTKISLLLLILLILLPSLSLTLSYFSTYTRVKGDLVLKLGEKTEIKEEHYEDGKRVRIHNYEDPVFVRLRVYAPERIEPLIKYEGEGWTYKEEDGWHYYDKVLLKDEEALMDVSVKTELLEGEEPFDLVVVYEALPAKEDDSGNWYADWSDTSLNIIRKEEVSHE